MTDYSPITLERTDTGWFLRINGFSEAATLGAYIWPSGVPHGVHIAMLEAVIEPAVIGDFEITGVDDAAVQAMDPWWTVYFSQNPAAPAPSGGSGVRSDHSVVVTDAIGTVIYRGHAQRLSSQGRVESWGEIEALTLELGLQQIGIPVGVLKGEASDLGATLALGIQASAAVALGIEVGTGVYFGPDGDIGWYHSLGSDWGFVVGVSVEAVGAGVKGGPSAFAGEFLGITIAGGELAVGGVTALYSPDAGAFIGLAAHVGAGLGPFPVSFYSTYSYTWLHPADDPTPV